MLRQGRLIRPERYCIGDCGVAHEPAGERRRGDQSPHERPMQGQMKLGEAMYKSLPIAGAAIRNASIESGDIFASSKIMKRNRGELKIQPTGRNLACEKKRQR